MAVKHQFHNKKRHIKISKPPKNSTLPTHTQPPTVEAEATKATQNLRPPSLPVSLSLSLGKLSYVRSYDKRANSEAASLCVVPFVQSSHPFLKPNSPNTEARSKKRSSPTDTISFQNIHFPLHSRRRETGELCSK